MDLEVDGNICVDSLLAKSVETLLQRNLREAMDKSISERIRSLDNAIQFIINLDHLDKSIKDVESYIKVIFRYSVENQYPTRNHNFLMK